MSQSSAKKVSWGLTVYNKNVRLLDDDFENSDAATDSDITHTYRKRHSVGLAEEGNLYDCG